MFVWPATNGGQVLSRRTLQLGRVAGGLRENTLTPFKGEVHFSKLNPIFLGLSY